MNSDTDYEIEIEYPDGLTGSGIPKRLRSSGTPICYASWMWSYPSSRSDCYFLHSGRTEWFLWIRFVDEIDDRVYRIAHGRMRKSGVDSNTAAKTLIKAFWNYNKKWWDIESPHEFTDGILLRADVSGIIRDVWGDKYDE